MLKNVFTLLLVVFVFSALLNAQEKTYMRPDGKFFKSSEAPSTYEVMKVKNVFPETGTFNSPIFNRPVGTNGLIDTLDYGAGGVNFGAFGQDVYLQWFRASADMTIKGFAFKSSDSTGVAAGAGFEGKIVSVNITEDSLKALGTRLLGYYPAAGNGYNDITAFLDNPDITGSYVSIDGSAEPFGNDIWSDGGLGYPITPKAPGSAYQWIYTDILVEPAILEDEIFGIVYKHTGVTMDADRLGVISGTGTAGDPGLKFYANGRFVVGVDVGWWSRAYTWNFLVWVDITGNTPPDINSFTIIPSGLDLGPFTIDADITDEDFGNPANAGVASATLYWKLDTDVTWNAVPMTGTEPAFSAVIPAQAAGSTVEYYLEATDIPGKTIVSSTKSFYIFTPTANTLVVFNGYSSVTGYPQDAYWGEDIYYGDLTFEHDRWAYGALTADVLNNYDNLIEICNGAPADYNDDVVRAWLAADGTRNYYLEGQEWLGARYNYVNKFFFAGDFEFDILGINESFNDVSYALNAGHLIPSLLMPQPGTLFGQPQLDIFATYSPVPDSIQFDPVYEGGKQNWIDGFKVEADVEVDVITETRGIDNVVNVQDLPAAAHRTLTGGNKIFFASYWTLFVNTTATNYNWLGWEIESPAYQALVWFGIPIVVDVNEVGSGVPEVYSLSQNYPNPFNPSTTINFALPQTSNVVLKVYDVLGREVITLLNGEKAAGNYEVSFDASQFASGMYIYTLQAGSFSTSKKMMLMK